MTVLSGIPTQLAVALLLRRGEISLQEIKVLPLVEDDDHAYAIADSLATWFEVEYYERRASESGFRVEDVMRLVTVPAFLDREKKLDLRTRM